MNRRSRAMLCLLSLLAVKANSQDTLDRETNAVADAEAQYLFINMLEFLGEFATNDGDWISPDILDEDAFADLDNTTDVTARPGVDTVNRRDLPAQRDDD